MSSVIIKALTINQKLSRKHQFIHKLIARGSVTIVNLVACLADVDYRKSNRNDSFSKHLEKLRLENVHMRMFQLNKKKNNSIIMVQKKAYILFTFNTTRR